MPDYSGYAQRPQQDPNLAAWGQISGNLANIFGLDPAKAAEARRGLQQEDYNAERNLAYIRQKAANKELGELIASGIDPSTGEFRNATDFQRYARITGELGNNPNMNFGTGFGANQLKIRMDAEQRAIDARATRDAAKAETDAKKVLTKSEAEARDDEIKRATADYKARMGGAGGVFSDQRITPGAFVNHIAGLSATGHAASGVPAFSGSVFDRSRKVLTPEYLSYMETGLKLPAAISDQNIPHLQDKIEEAKVALARAYGVTPDEYKTPEMQAQLDIVAKRMIAGQIESYRKNDYDTGTNVDTTEGLDAAIAQFKAQTEAKRLNPLKPFYVNVPKVVTHDQNGNLLAMPRVIRVVVPIQTIIEDADKKNPNNPETWPNFKAARGGM